MTRQQQAVEYAKQAFIELNPIFIDREFRIQWWKHAHPIEKEMFLEAMTELANQDLGRVEELVVAEEKS